jgi:hypothetical protein
MLFGQEVSDNKNNRLIEKIKNDLITTLKRKGIKIHKIQIDMTSDNLNVSVCIKEK